MPARHPDAAGARPARRRRLAVGWLAALGLGAMALGFAGDLSPPLDSFSHFRAHLGAAMVPLALAALAVRLRIVALALVLGSAAALAQSLPYLVGGGTAEAPAGPRYTLLQMNVRWDAPERTGALRRIAEAQPDIVTLQEMTPGWREALAPLGERYPHQLHCEDADGFLGDSAILSRRPFTDGTQTICDRRNSFAAARIDFNGVAVTVASHHQFWPWPDGQWRRLERLRETLAGLPAPLILAGDFNAVPWSALVGQYADETGTHIVRGVGPSWFLPFLPAEWGRWAGLPIDNVLASQEIAVTGIRRMEAAGSDHLPVLVTFTVENGGPSEPPVQIVGR